MRISKDVCGYVDFGLGFLWTTDIFVLRIGIWLIEIYNNKKDIYCL